MATTEKINVKNFKKELKELLKKYNATIGFDCDDCSDLYGIYDEHVYIQANGERERVVDGWWIDETDF